MGLNPDDLNDPPAEPGDFAALPVQTQEYIKSLRKESAGHRVRNKILEGQLAKLGSSDSAAQIRKLSIDNHLLQKGTVDPKLARFYLSEEGQLDDLDPAVEGWTTLLDDRISDLIGRHPELRQRNVPTRSSTSSGGGGNNMTSGQLSRADAQRMTPAEVVAAYQTGHFDSLLGRKQ